MAKSVKKGRGRNGKSVKDYQRGDAANGYDVAVDGEDFDGKNEHFEPSGKTLAEYFDVVDEADSSIRAIMDAARKKCQPHRKTISTTTKAMVQQGYRTKELATLTRKHRIERKLEGIADNLDHEAKQFFLSLERALGEFQSTPLGEAAIKQAAQAIQH